MTREDLEKVKSLFAGSYLRTHDQENYFFDGAEGELSRHYHIMRLRFYNKDEKAILTVKVRYISLFRRVTDVTVM